MFCQNCKTPFEIIPIAEGKRKFCKKCGNLIYKKENNAIIVFHPSDENEKTEEEIELRESIIREKELRNKEQLERKQKEQEFRKRIQQERLIKEKEEQKKKEEQEKILQLELEALNKKQLEKEEQNKEQEKLLQLELEKQKAANLKLEIELREREEKIESEKLKLAIAKNELIEKEKETAKINFPIDQKNNRTILIQPTKNKWKNIALPLFAGILLTLTFLFIKSKVATFTKTIKTKTVLASTDTNAFIINSSSNLDTALLHQLRENLVGQEILSWNSIQPNDIKELKIISGNKQGDKIMYNVSINLEDKSITKAVAELTLNYNKTSLETITTNHITYRNIAPVNAWFSFAPIPNCSISVNTNNNPIQLKSCKDCSILKMVSNIEKPQSIDYSTTIFIRSDNKYDAIIEFTYVPTNLNQ